MSTSTEDADVVVSKLRAEFNGRVVTPEDAGYDDARVVFSGAVDRRPAAVVRVADAAEVARVVGLTREAGLELAVRSGGHSGAGHGVCDDGIVLDMAGMQAVDVDAGNRSAWAQTGLTAAQYTNAVGEYELAMGFGDVGSVGIAGITLGGGVGYLSRKYGLTIDDLLAAEVVTADGEVRHVDDDNHPDLFWAIRGGGGNFGVATRVKFRLHEVSSAIGGMLILPATPDVVASVMAEAQAAPEELSTIVSAMVAPPMPFLPAEVHGQVVVMVALCYAGPVEAGERAVAPFRALATPIADMVRPMRYPEIYPPEQPYRPIFTGHTLFLDSFGSDMPEMIIDRLQSVTASMAVVQLRALGGAVARVPADATAYAHRDRRIMVNVAAMFQDVHQSAEHSAWVGDVGAAMHDGTPGAYVNFLNDEGPERVRAAYPGTTWDRLREIKSRYDPTNLFHHNQNIPPL